MPGNNTAIRTNSLVPDLSASRRQLLLLLTTATRCRQLQCRLDVGALLGPCGVEGVHVLVHHVVGGSRTQSSDRVAVDRVELGTFLQTHTHGTVSIRVTDDTLRRCAFGWAPTESHNLA